MVRFYFFQPVSFKYKNAKNITIDDVNFNLKTNTTVGIVGESGSGKSTLISMLTGIIHPDKGCMEIDGRSYKQYNMLDIRSKIGYVTQESVIFNDSIANNITMWAKPVDNNKLVNCAKMALAYDFILDQKNEFDEQLGDNGINLSGGQRQRIIIARELYKNSKMLIFDEATSALDSESEREIQKSIHQLKGKKTILIITHRLFTLKECDIIYLIKKGKVADFGSFEELMHSSEEFKNMHIIQNLNKE